MASVTTSVALTAERALIQNKGPGDLYVSHSNPATSSNGVKVVTGGAVAVNGNRWVYVVSSGTSDVRVLERGQGYF